MRVVITWDCLQCDQPQESVFNPVYYTQSIDDRECLAAQAYKAEHNQIYACPNCGETSFELELSYFLIQMVGDGSRALLKGHPSKAPFSNGRELR